MKDAEPLVATTKRLVAVSLLFSMSASVPLVVADAIWGIGFVPRDLMHRLGGLHWLFHFGTLALSTLGAFIAWKTNDQQPSIRLAGGSGLLFGGVSIVAAPAALVVFDVEGCVIWQFLGAMFTIAGLASLAPIPPYVRSRLRR